MWPGVIVFSAISAIQVALVRYIKTALQRFAVDEPFTRFQNVIAGEFARNFIEKLHAMKEYAAYDNLLVKQSPWGRRFEHGQRKSLGLSAHQPAQSPIASEST